MLGWVARCLPGFSIIGLIILLVFTFSDILTSARWGSVFPSWVGQPFKEGWWSGLNVAQAFFVVYAVIIHVQMSSFTLRLAWSIFQVTAKTREALGRRPAGKFAVSPSPSAQDEGYSSEPISPVSLPSPDPFTEKINPMSIGSDPIENELIHAIILPNYCEDLHTLETTLKVLASHPRAKSQYEVG
ncbi:hypothetical protein N7486_003050 [Penicillium sp. IBT 16267x]|nr:hypothetical protein N7486_003050 [Penicillium sp. IBT 16267x]